MNAILVFNPEMWREMVSCSAPQQSHDHTQIMRLIIKQLYQKEKFWHHFFFFNYLLFFCYAYYTVDNNVVFGNNVDFDADD